MTEKWTLIRRSGDYVEIGKKLGVSPILARIMRNRGIEFEDMDSFLDPAAQTLYNGVLLKDSEKLIACLEKKIREKKKIRVIGDYDIDGIFASYILIRSLEQTGAVCDYVIPHRKKDGYGLNDRLIREAAQEGVDTVLTCDNGISAHGQITLGNSLGLTILVTDHHAIPWKEDETGERRENLPEAYAVVDPHREGDGYPFKTLCGAAVAWKIADLLLDRFGIDKNESEKLLELAAFATIGDVMPLIGENRTIVKLGLERLENTWNKGLKKLIDINGLADKRLSCYSVGFVLGPCINAAGRLSSAGIGLELLMAKGEEESSHLAEILKELNESRKTMTEQGFKEALELSQSPKHRDEKILVLLLENGNEAVSGIIAGRIRESTGKPCFILSRGNLSDGTPCLKGSGRSIENYNMYAGLSEIGDLFVQFGGHSMAAGLSILEDRLQDFEFEINERSNLTEDDISKKIKIDMELPLRYVTMDLAQELTRLEPFGTGNEEPLFVCRGVRLLFPELKGQKQNVLRCRAQDGSGRIEAVYFGEAESFLSYIKDNDGMTMMITYAISINEFNGYRSVQIIIRNYRAESTLGKI